MFWGCSSFSVNYLSTVLASPASPVARPPAHTHNWGGREGGSGAVLSSPTRLVRGTSLLVGQRNVSEVGRGAYHTFPLHPSSRTVAREDWSGVQTSRPMRAKEGSAVALRRPPTYANYFILIHVHRARARNAFLRTADRGRPNHVDIRSKTTHNNRRSQRVMTAPMYPAARALQFAASLNPPSTTVTQRRDRRTRWC